MDNIYSFLIVLCLEDPHYCTPPQQDCVELCLSDDEMHSWDCVHLCKLVDEEEESQE